MSLSELKEDGVIRVTDQSYTPWKVHIEQLENQEIALKACRLEGSEEICYEQRYVRSFGANVIAGSNP